MQISGLIYYCLLACASLAAMLGHSGASASSLLGTSSGPSKAKSGVDDEPIHLAGYSYARFLAGTSTNTRFVTTTASTTVTCISKVDNAATACPSVGRRKRRRSVRALYATEDSSAIDSSLLLEDHSPSEQDEPSLEGRLLFKAATIFTTLTFTQNVAGAKTISISVSCVPVGAANICLMAG